MLSIGLQLRVAPMGGVVGIDYTAALEMARARGHDCAATAEFLPVIEAGIVTGLGKMRSEDG